MFIMDSFMNYVFDFVALEAGSLSRYYNEKLTLSISSREVQTTVRLLFPEELAMQAVSEGNMNVVRFSF